MTRALPLVIAVALVFAFVAESHAQTIDSPRLQALERALAQGSPDAVESFWREVATKGTPLVERPDEHEGFALVTFVWRGDENTKHVFIEGSWDNCPVRGGLTIFWRNCAARMCGTGVIGCGTTFIRFTDSGSMQH